jgi:two-component system OmpR family sensor kinase/two-component system sensor histidine kinase QseC
MNSIRVRLSLALILLLALVSLFVATLTYRRVLSETSDLFDYQLRQMALSLRAQVTLAPRIEVPPDQGDSDFIVQIWDLFGARVYFSRPGLPLINQAVLGYADLKLGGEAWRGYGLQTTQGVIEIAQPLRVRARIARATALRLIAPFLLVLPIMVACVIWIVGRGLGPLRQLTAEVQRRDAGSLAPLGAADLPQEIAPLVAELNRLLTRLAGAFATQRAFIADAAHELRSPLTALRLQAQLLERAPDEAARGEARGRLAAAIERATHLVQQLLTLARSEPQQQVLSRESLDLGAAAADAIKESHSLALAKSIELSLEAEPGVRVRAERDGMHALLRNLVDNAVRYTPAGGRVQVRTRAGADRAIVEISDTGPGIPAEERERVFDRFYRRNAAVVDPAQPEVQSGGTGLGLAIVKAVADRHGAPVQLRTAPGGGLRVDVSFLREL